MFLTYKYRLKDRSVKKKLTEHSYAINQVWNYCVTQQRDSQDRYKAGAKPRRFATAFELQRLCNGVGKELRIYQQSVQAVCTQFAVNRDKIRHAPKFRSSFGSKRSLGWIPFKQPKVKSNSITYMDKSYRWFGNKHRQLPDNVKSGAFVEDALGRWWVCFNVESAHDHIPGNSEIGIDLGLKTLATLSDGTKIENLKHRQTWAQRLAKAQRARNKRRTAKIHSRIAGARRDNLHKITTELAARYALIAVGNVNSKGLAKTRMAKSVYDAAWSIFRNFLKYKASCYVKVDERFTTQTCSGCGSIAGPKGRAGLNERSWICDGCGSSHDRDVNSAINILYLGLSAQARVDESRLKSNKHDNLRAALKPTKIKENHLCYHSHEESLPL